VSGKSDLTAELREGGYMYPITGVQYGFTTAIIVLFFLAVFGIGCGGDPDPDVLSSIAGGSSVSQDPSVGISAASQSPSASPESSAGASGSSEPAVPGVYMAVILENNAGTHDAPAYTHNDTLCLLTAAADDTDGFANAITVLGSDIYAAGSYGGKPVYWKTRLGVAAGAPIPISVNDGETYAMRIIRSGGQETMYFAGNEGSDACYWKIVNGGAPVKTTLAPGIAYSLFVESQGGSETLHIAGGNDSAGSGFYWNGTSAQFVNAYTLFSVFVKGSTVYLAGEPNDVWGGFWYGGSSFTYIGIDEAYLENVIYVDSLDRIYVGGDHDRGGIYRYSSVSDADPVGLIPPTAANNAWVCDIAEAGGSIYAAGSWDALGTDQGHACYWKDEVLIHQFTEPAGYAYSYATGIFVVP
jgi:hypothetical protein